MANQKTSQNWQWQEDGDILQDYMSTSSEMHGEPKNKSGDGLDELRKRGII